jgi:hypothetical protein
LLAKKFFCVLKNLSANFGCAKKVSCSLRMDTTNFSSFATICHLQHSVLFGMDGRWKVFGTSKMCRKVFKSSLLFSDFRRFC